MNEESLNRILRLSKDYNLDTIRGISYYYHTENRDKFDYDKWFHNIFSKEFDSFLAVHYIDNEIGILE